MANTTSRHEISFDEAKGMIQSFQNSVPPSARKSCYFDRAAFDAILAQKDCVGIQIYYATGPDGKVTLVFAGRNAAKVVQDGVDPGQSIMELGDWCPPICDYTDRFSK